jgi:hypothetical protein
MRCYSAFVLIGLAASVFATPVDNAHRKRAAVLTERAYADFQVSDGVAGNALAEGE